MQLPLCLRKLRGNTLRALETRVWVCLTQSTGHRLRNFIPMSPGSWVRPGSGRQSVPPGRHASGVDETEGVDWGIRYTTWGKAPWQPFCSMESCVCLWGHTSIVWQKKLQFLFRNILLNSHYPIPTFFMRWPFNETIALQLRTYVAPSGLRWSFSPSHTAPSTGIEQLLSHVHSQEFGPDLPGLVLQPNAGQDYAVLCIQGMKKEMRRGQGSSSGRSKQKGGNLKPVSADANSPQQLSLHTYYPKLHLRTYLRSYRIVGLFCGWNVSWITGISIFH